MVSKLAIEIISRSVDLNLFHFLAHPHCPTIIEAPHHISTQTYRAWHNKKDVHLLKTTTVFSLEKNWRRWFFITVKQQKQILTFITPLKVRWGVQTVWQYNSNSLLALYSTLFAFSKRLINSCQLVAFQSNLQAAAGLCVE